MLGGLVLLGVVRSREVPRIGEDEPPLSYRIAYRVDEPGKPTSLQILTVRRPFDGRNETSRADGSDSAGIAATAVRAWRLAGGAVESDLGPKAPSTPPGDARPLLVMGRAIHEGLAKQAGLGRVRGRACTRYAVAEPPGKPLGPPGPVSRTELCVDRQGLVLEERWTSGRKLVRRRRAIEVEISPSLDDAVFLIGHPTSDDSRAVVPVADDERILSPSGFRFEGAYTIRGTTRVEAWVRGADALLVEAIEAPSPPWVRSPRGIRVGSAELVLDLVASQLRFTAGEGRHVRISGSVSPDELVAAAKSLEGA